VGFINKYGDEVIPPIYEEAQPFREGYSKVKMNGEDGWINKNNEQ
jgi:hypothetical protein